MRTFSPTEDSISPSFLFGEGDLLDVQEIQLNRSRAPEDRHRNFQRGLIFVNFFNLTRKTLERPRFDADRFAGRIRKLWLWLLLSRGLLIQNLIDLILGQRRRRLPANESRHLWGRANRMKDVIRNMTAVVTIDLNQDVT